MHNSINIVLAGNPNSGKSTVFNNLTGSRQHIGNYPGVTVEKKEGICKFQDHKINVVDLPGTYSLSAYSPEEIIARKYIINEKPDVVVNILDASNLERNLYLTIQLIEMGVPIIAVLNMSDLAKAQGYQFDLEKLSALLKVPILPMVGHKNQGTNDLKRKIVEVSKKKNKTDPSLLKYGREISRSIGKISDRLEKYTNMKEEKRRWVALKLLENDEEIDKEFEDLKITSLVRDEQKGIEKALGENVATAISSYRYGFISGACTQSVRSTIERRHTISDMIDLVATNKFIGIPVFLGLMYLVFWITFTLGGPLMDWIDLGFSWLGDSIIGLWPENSDSALKSLLVDGIIGGVGGVVIFLPNILLLFLAIAILEDSGYMARAAFIMDRLMNKIGLHGKSFIPMLIGFGCSVPAIMATRTLDNKRDRLVTMLVVPLMSCGARLPIYALIIPAFFPQKWHAPMLWLIYIIGILLAIILSKLLRSTLFKGDTVPFLMELPPYRMPTLKGIIIHMWERGSLYLKKAGTLILGISIVLWFMTTYPKKTEFSQDYEAQLSTVSEIQTTNPELYEQKIKEILNEKKSEELSYTLAGRIGHAIEPFIKTMGFDWRIGTALIGAFAAKEVFVAQLGIVYSVGEADEESVDLREKLKSNYTPLIGFAIMLFTLISAPCMATIAVTKRESNSWKWALFQLGGLTLVAWLFTTLVYQIGMIIS